MRTPWTSRAPRPPATPPAPAGADVPAADGPAVGGAVRGGAGRGGTADGVAAGRGAAGGAAADRDRAWRRARRRAARAHHPDLGGDAAALEAALAAVDAAFGRGPHPADPDSAAPRSTAPPRVRRTLRAQAARRLHLTLLARRRRSRARRSTGRVD